MMPEGQAIGILLLVGGLGIIFGLIMLFDRRGPEMGAKILLGSCGMIALAILRGKQINKNK